LTEYMIAFISFLYNAQILRKILGFFYISIALF